MEDYIQTIIIEEIIMSDKSKRISSDELAMFAAQGLERALEARQSAGIELTRTELEQVSGGGIWGSIVNFFRPRKPTPDKPPIITAGGIKAPSFRY